MEIDVIAPSTWTHIRLELDVSCLNVHSETLMVGLNNGDFQAFLSDNQDEEGYRTPIVQNDKHPKSLDYVRSLFITSKSLWRPYFVFENATIDRSALNDIKCVDLKQSESLLFIASSSGIHVYKYQARSLHFIELLTFNSSIYQYKVCELENRILLAVGVKKRLRIYEIEEDEGQFSVSLIRDLQLKEKIRAIDCIERPGAQMLILLLLNNLAALNLLQDCSALTFSLDDPNVTGFSLSSSFKYFGLGASNSLTKLVKVSEDEIFLLRDMHISKLNYSPNGIFTISGTNFKLRTDLRDFGVLDSSYVYSLYNMRIDLIECETGDVVQSFSHMINSSNISITLDRDSLYMGYAHNILKFHIYDYKKRIDQYRTYFEKDEIYNSKYRMDFKILGILKSILLVSNLDKNDNFFEDKTNSRPKQKQLCLRKLYLDKAITLFEISKFHEALIDIGTSWVLSLKDILPLFPDFINGEAQIKGISLSNPSTPLRNTTALELKSDLVSNTSESEIESDLKEQDVSIKESIKTSKSKIAHVRKFVKAVNNLIVYLTDQRRINYKFIGDEPSNSSITWNGIELTPFDIYPFLNKNNFRAQLEDIITIIDTTLFLCYFYTKPMMLGPLLRLPTNKCDSNVVKGCLIELNGRSDRRYVNELLDFYYGRKLHREALEMLHTTANANKSKGNEKEYAYYVILSIQYIQKLDNSNLDLVLEQSRWIFQDNPKSCPEYASLIFMNDSFQSESYNCLKVLTFLLEDLCNDTIAIAYLEWILNDVDIIEKAQKEDRRILATKFVLLILNSLKELPEEEIRNHAKYKNLVEFLENDPYYNPVEILNELSRWGGCFLRLSASVYKHQGEHMKAINILFNSLQDLDAAMNYCAEIYNVPHGQSLGQNLLHKLLDDILSSRRYSMTMVKDMLDHQGAKMNMMRVLKQIPQAYPLSQLSSFFTFKLRELNEEVFDKRLIAKLHGSANVKVYYNLLEARNQSFMIENSDQICPICNKRLGYGIFSGSSNHEVCHYACYQKKLKNSS